MCLGFVERSSDESVLPRRAGRGRMGPELTTVGTRTRNELKPLVKMAKAPVSMGAWRAVSARWCRVLAWQRDSRSERAPLLVSPRKQWTRWSCSLLQRACRRPTILSCESSTLASPGTKELSVPRETRDTVGSNGCCPAAKPPSSAERPFTVLVDAFDSYGRQRDPDLNWITTAAWIRPTL